MRALSGASGAFLPTRNVAAARTADRSSPTRRRLFGLSVLLVAGTALLVAAPLVGVGVRGTAAAAVIPLPPPLGSCVLIGDDGAATVVDCTEPHTGEIAMTWRAGVAPVDAGSAVRDPHFSVARSISDPYADTRCAEWVERYTGWDRYLARHTDDLWLAPQPLSTGRLVRAPIDPALHAWGWTGCAAVTGDPTYTSSLRDTAFAPRPVPGPRPAAVSVCLTSTADSLSFGSCTEPHNTELLGSVALTQQMMFDRSVTVEHSTADVLDACRQLAVVRTGRADPTFGGRLEVVAESVYQRSLRNPQPSVSSWLIPDCLIRVVGTGTLTGSLVEWGDQPLTVRG